MTQAESLAFAPEEEAAILRHMNGDHADDSLLMCRAFGAQPAATAAVATAVDRAGIEFSATVEGAPVAVRIPFSHQLTARGEVRAEIVRMYREACEALGIPPREEASH